MEHKGLAIMPGWCKCNMITRLSVMTQPQPCQSLLQCKYISFLLEYPKSFLAWFLDEFQLLVVFSGAADIAPSGVYNRIEPTLRRIKLKDTSCTGFAGNCTDVEPDSGRHLNSPSLLKS